MTDKLNIGERHALRLAQRDADVNGWTKVSAKLWPLISKLPADLVEFRPAESGGGHIRLTERGHAVVDYL